MFDPKKAGDYLRARFQDPPGLCCESIGKTTDADFEGTFWLMNDNSLAVLALDRLGDSALRDKIKSRLENFRIFGHDAFRNRGWVDPLIHQEVYYLEPLKTAGCYRYDESSKSFGPRLKCDAGMGGVIQEEWDGLPYEDEDRYFNLSASKALSWHKQYDRTQNADDRAKRDHFMTCTETLWNQDHDGFGTPDNDGNMTTYYLAAYLIVGEKTGWPRQLSQDRRTQVETLLNSLQLRHGGFATWYRKESGKPLAMDQGGNIETTSLGVYANVRPAEYPNLVTMSKSSSLRRIFSRLRKVH